jgi:hypothetical protein
MLTAVQKVHDYVQLVNAPFDNLGTRIPTGIRKSEAATPPEEIHALASPGTIGSHMWSIRRPRYVLQIRRSP